MMIIIKTPDASGAYPAPQTWHKETPPDGYAVIADGVDLADFYAHNGFATLTIEAIAHTRPTEKMVAVEKSREVEGENGTEIEPYYEDEIQTVDEVYYIDTVTAYTPNVEAWEAWKASLPEPTEDEPSWNDQIEAQVVYTAMMTDTLL